MRWCNTHFQWEIWMGEKLVATLWGGADEIDKTMMYRQVVDVVLDPRLEFSEGIPHQERKR